MLARQHARHPPGQDTPEARHRGEETHNRRAARRGDLKTPLPRIAGIVAVLLGIAVVCVLVWPRFIHRPASTPGQSVASLPGGVCPLSTHNLPVAEATRMEARLVTYQTAAASDPYFPWRAPAFASVPRLPTPSEVSHYLWVVAGEGSFHFQFPQPPQAGTDTGSFSDVLFYIPADSCDTSGGSAVRGMNTWPAWFDSMKALSDTKIK